MLHLKKVIEKRYGQPLTDKEDLQALRLQVEEAKINLTSYIRSDISLQLHSFGESVIFHEILTRDIFEDLNKDLLLKVLEPIDKVLENVEMTNQDVDEIVLVGGSTRIPKVRELVAEYFEKEPNTSIEPELAVATGVSIQAGIIGGMWPLTVSAVELPTAVKKIHIH